MHYQRVWSHLESNPAHYASSAPFLSNTPCSSSKQFVGGKWFIGFSPLSLKQTKTNSTICYRLEEQWLKHWLAIIIFIFRWVLTGALLSDSSSSSACDDAVSPWWENIRHSLAQSTATRRALSLAVVCRAVAMEISTASRKVEVK